jgi:hypothetical protein
VSSRPTLLVVLAFSESLRFDGLAMVRTQGIYNYRVIGVKVPLVYSILNSNT